MSFAVAQQCQWRASSVRREKEVENPITVEVDEIDAAEPPFWMSCVMVAHCRGQTAIARNVCESWRTGVWFGCNYAAGASHDCNQQNERKQQGPPSNVLRGKQSESRN